MRILVLALAAAIGGGACSPSPPSLAEQRRATTALEGSFEVLDDLGVTFYDNAQDCRILEDRRGAFVKDDDPNGFCVGADGALPFDDTTEAEFEKLHAALVTDGVAATGVAQTRYDDGRLIGAWFAVRTLLGDLTYYYEADRTPPLDWDTKASVANQVSDHWWFAIP